MTLEVTPLLFDRVAVVSVGRANAAGRSFRSVVTRGDDGKAFGGFRIGFKIDKTMDSASNKSQISLFNLARESVAALEQTKNYIVLESGFKNLTEIVHRGEVKNIIPKRQGNDSVWDIEAGDGESVLTGPIDISLARATAEDLMAQAIKEMTSRGVALGVTERTSEGLKKTFPNGFSYSGTIKDLMDYAARSAGLHWWIDDMTLHVAKRGERKVEAIVIGPETGLIDIPSRTEKGLFRIRSILNPKVRPGTFVKIESRTFPAAASGRLGAVVIQAARVMHQGDSHAGEWVTEIEGPRQD